MDMALNPQGKRIVASGAKYGIYFCTECHELSFLRKQINAKAHFYHVRYNDKCSLSVKSNRDFNNVLVKKYFDILQCKYSDRWNEAIDILIVHNYLHLLYGKEWALTPITYYINTHIENISTELFYEFIYILIGINTIKSFKILLQIMDFRIITNDNRNLIEEYIYSEYTYSDEIFDYILNELKPDEFFMLKYFVNTSEKQQKIILKNEKYNIISDIVYIFSSKNHIERYNYFVNKYNNTTSNGQKNRFNEMVLYYIEYYQNKPEYKLLRINNIYNDLYEYIINNKHN
jgi:hypothetical protein